MLVKLKTADVEETAEAGGSTCELRDTNLWVVFSCGSVSPIVFAAIGLQSAGGPTGLSIS